MRINECRAFKSCVAYSPLWSRRFLRLPDSSDKSIISAKQMHLQQFVVSTKQTAWQETRHKGQQTASKHARTNTILTLSVASTSLLYVLQKNLCYAVWVKKGFLTVWQGEKRHRHKIILCSEVVREKWHVKTYTSHDWFALQWFKSIKSR